jgi:hypothetical protein
LTKRQGDAGWKEVVGLDRLWSPERSMYWRVYFRGNRRKQRNHYPYRVVYAPDEIGALKEFYAWCNRKEQRRGEDK